MVKRPDLLSDGAMADDWLSVGEAARLVGVSRSTIDRYINEGKLQAKRLPSGHRRVRREDALRLLGELDGRAEAQP